MWVSAFNCRMYSTSSCVSLPGYSFCWRARVYHHSLLDSVNGAVTSSLPNNRNIHQTSLHVTEQVKYHYLKWAKKLEIKKLILFIEGILIDAEHPFDRLMQGKVVILDILAKCQLSDASQYSGSKKEFVMKAPYFHFLLQ